MKKTIFTLFICFASGVLLAQTVSFNWVKQMGGTSSENGLSIATDASGNVYTAGYFQGTADFDPGPGTFSLTAASDDIFVSKSDAAGNFLWAKQMGGASVEHAMSIAVDAAGNVYTTGYFSSSPADFDPGPGVFNLIPAGFDDIFISKLDASGNFVWAKQIGGAGEDFGYSIAVDGSGNVYTTGFFAATVDFDPGAGVFNLSSVGGTDIFVLKLDAGGNFVWAKQMEGAGQGYSIAVDAAGNVYTTGIFAGTVDFDPGPGTDNLTYAGGSGQDIFVSKLDASGNFVWARQMGGVSPDQGKSIAVDAAGNVYTTGFFQGTANFDPGGVFNLTALGADDIFISKLDASGNFVWAKQMGGTSDDVGLSIAVDASGNVYTTGDFQGVGDFDPGAGVFNLTTSGGEDIFISKLDAAGNFVWAQQIGGASAISQALSIAVDASGNIYATGLFLGTTDFDPGAGVFNLTSSGVDIFVEKLGQPGSLPITLIEFSGTAGENGNQLKWVTATEINNDHFELERSADAGHFGLIAKINGAGNSNRTITYDYLDPAPMISTANYYRLKQVDWDGRSSYSPVIKVLSVESELRFTLFPNPAHHFINIVYPGKKEVITVSIYDAQGRLVKRQTERNARPIEVGVEELEPGIYFIHLEDGETMQNGRFIRQ